MSMQIDGGCHCGYIKYQAEVDPSLASMCHCADCQTLGGGALRTALPTPQTQFQLLSGEPKTYVKTAESGNKRAQVFCPECGTHLYATSVGNENKTLNLRIATAQQRDQMPPRRQVWFGSRQSWATELSEIPHKLKQ